VHEFYDLNISSKFSHIRNNKNDFVSHKLKKINAEFPIQNRTILQSDIR